MTTCPVLEFTPEIRHALHVFDATHEQSASFGSVFYRRTCLPVAGGALDQDAWLMQALDALRGAHNQVLAEELDRRRDRDTTSAT